MSRYFSCLTVLVLVSTVYGEIARTPAIQRIKSWEPYDESLGNCWQTILDNTTDTDKNQGYGSTFRYKDETEFDDDFEYCARAFFDIINAGILYINTHGTDNTGWPVVVTAKTRPAAEAWVAAGSGDQGFEIWQPNVDQYVIVAKPVALQKVLKPWNDRVRTIVIGQYCYSTSTLDDVGGRVGFGYTGVCYASSTKRDVNKLLRRMNGTTDGQKKRIATDAFGAGGFTAGFDLVGNGATTLCPSVVNKCKDNAQPWGSGAGREGDGFVNLDTAITQSYADPAEQTLTYTSEKGEVDISDIEFIFNKDRLITGIKFHYRADCTGDFKVIMTLVAKRVVGDLNGKLCLDGNDAKEKQQQEGKADHLDDFVWSFED